MNQYSWHDTPSALQASHALASADGKVAQRTTATSGQKQIWDALELTEPPWFFDFRPAVDQ